MKASTFRITPVWVNGFVARYAVEVRCGWLPWFRVLANDDGSPTLYPSQADAERAARVVIAHVDGTPA